MTTLNFNAQELSWLSSSVWATGVDDLNGVRTSPWIGGRYLLGASLRNTGKIFGQNDELLFNAVPAGLGFSNSPKRLIGRSHVSAAALQHVDVQCLSEWRAPHFYESQDQIIVSLDNNEAIARRNLIIACALDNKFVVKVPLSSSLHFNPANLSVTSESSERIEPLVHGLSDHAFNKTSHVKSWWFQDAQSGSAISLAGTLEGDGALLHLEYSNENGFVDGVSILIVDGCFLGKLVGTLGNRYDYKMERYANNRVWQRH